MSAPDRPTREQVDAELARVDAEHEWTDSRRLLLAAEVRALRAEQEAALVALNADGPLVSAAKFVREATDAFAARAALVARTPQPAEPTARGICGDRLSPPAGSLPSYCDLPAGHEGWHQMQGGPRWSFDLERPFTAVSVPSSPAAAPLPAVPDGEDRPDLHDAIQRVGEYVAAHHQQGDRRVDLIDEKVFDDNRGGWSGELYVSDLRAILSAVVTGDLS